MSLFLRARQRCDTPTLVSFAVGLGAWPRQFSKPEMGRGLDRSSAFALHCPVIDSEPAPTAAIHRQSAGLPSAPLAAPPTWHLRIVVVWVCFPLGKSVLFSFSAHNSCSKEPRTYASVPDHRGKENSVSRGTGTGRHWLEVE